MTFIVPEMPLSVNIWTEDSGPPAPPRLTCAGNLAFGRRVSFFTDLGNASTAILGQMVLLVPAGTDIRDASTTSDSDVIEVPAGSSRIYIVVYVDDMGKGFPNEHRFAIIQKHPEFVWPIPIP